MVSNMEINIPINLEQATIAHEYIWLSTTPVSCFYNMKNVVTEFYNKKNVVTVAVIKCMDK